MYLTLHIVIGQFYLNKARKKTHKSQKKKKEDGKTGIWIIDILQHLAKGKVHKKTEGHHFYTSDDAHQYGFSVRF